MAVSIHTQTVKIRHRAFDSLVAGFYLQRRSVLVDILVAEAVTSAASGQFLCCHADKLRLPVQLHFFGAQLRKPMSLS